MSADAAATLVLAVPAAIFIVVLAIAIACFMWGRD